MMYKGAIFAAIFVCVASATSISGGPKRSLVRRDEAAADCGAPEPCDLPCIVEPNPEQPSCLKCICSQEDATKEADGLTRPGPSFRERKFKQLMGLMAALKKNLDDLTAFVSTITLADIQQMSSLLFDTLKSLMTAMQPLIGEYMKAAASSVPGPTEIIGMVFSLMGKK